MKPQPPVTRIRTARASSAEAGALADFPLLGDYMERWKNALAASEWMPWLIIGLAAFLRFFLLGMKPPHFDEGINGWFVDQMVKTSFYKYDPTNYHGPLHFYVLLLSQTLFGRNLWALRLPVVLVSISCVWLTLKFEPFVGQTVSRLAALAMALSPGFVFYGRYSIHEVWLVLFTMLFFYGLFGLWKSGTEGHGHEKPWYYWLALISHYELPVLAGLLLCIFALRFKAMSLRYLAIYGVGTLIAYSIVKYKTPWCIISFIWPFLFIFGALVPTAPLRFAAVTYRWCALLLFGLLAYTVYYAQTNKWSATYDHMWPYALILGTALLLVTLRSPQMIKLLASILICWSLGHCIWLNYFRCTTDTEPYVYVQTYNDIYKFTDPVLQLAHSDPRAYQLVGHIIRASPYPLPWMLDDFGRVGYYEKNNMPDKVDGDFLLVQQDKITAVEAKLHGSYYTFPVTIRPYQDPSKAYFSARIFKSFFPGQWPDFTGAVPAPMPSPSPAK